MRFRSLGREDPLKKDMATTPVFLPGESHGQRSLGAYSPWGHKEFNTTERPSTSTHSVLRTAVRELYFTLRMPRSRHKSSHM